MKIRDRIIRFERVRASELVECPWNWRSHPERQRAALRGLLEEVGFAGAALTRVLPDGRRMLIDGHLRREESGDELIPVLVTDLTEEEALKLLAAFDPLSQMAGTDKGKLGALLKEVSTGNQALAYLFTELKEANGVTIDAADLELDVEEDGSALPAPPAAEEIEPSHVRMVQLFLDTETLPPFQRRAAQLAAHYGTRSLTDTICECIRREARRLARGDVPAPVSEPEPANA